LEKQTMVDHKLETEQASAYYDPESGIVFVAYSGVLTSEPAKEVYAWLGKLLQEIDINSLHGQVFDFRNVSEFDNSNLKTARRTSNRMNMSVDTSHVPVALLVSDPYHQEILLGSMRISPENVRKKIVWSEDEALEFFASWHNKDD
jgi:hypothetical protein